MKATVHTTGIEGCLRIVTQQFQDNRGSFLKTYHEQFFQELNLETSFAEEFYSYSHKDVVRGLHFQTPPYDHTKLVYCLAGEVMDVVVDIRRGSPTYGRCETFRLSAEEPQMIYIPSGMAHGFVSRSDHALMAYKVTTVHAPANDSGILWSSIGIDWGVEEPIISQRDQSFVPLEQFKSPFLYGKLGVAE